jgi:IclR family acetate operon transcriptional repressor
MKSAIFKNMARTLDLKRPRGRPPSVKAAQATSSVQSLDRALALLELIADEDGLTLTELAQRAGVPPSTAHRILSTLEARDYVHHEEERGLWLIGVKAFEVGSSFLRNRKLATTGRAIMRKLMDECGESVNLAIEDDGSIVFISQIESHHSIRAFHRPGSRGAVHASGVGKALLSTLSSVEVRRVLHKTGLEKFTDKTLVDPDKLFTELEATRMRGWAIDDEERTPGMRCIAAPIYNEHGEAFAGLSVSGPIVRISDERIGELGPMVKRAAEEITQSIGGHPPE